MALTPRNVSSDSGRLVRSRQGRDEAERLHVAAGRRAHGNGHARRRARPRDEPTCASRGAIMGVVAGRPPSHAQQHARRSNPTVRITTASVLTTATMTGASADSAAGKPRSKRPGRRERKRRRTTTRLTGLFPRPHAHLGDGAARRLPSPLGQLAGGRVPRRQGERTDWPGSAPRLTIASEESARGAGRRRHRFATACAGDG